jgi:hypothetical protein
MKTKDIVEVAVNRLGKYLEVTRCSIHSSEVVGKLEAEYTAQGFPPLSTLVKGKRILCDAIIMMSKQTLITHLFCWLYNIDLCLSF